MTSHEGVLSFMRDELVANEILARHALRPGLDLAPVLRALPFEPPRALRQARLAPDEEDDGKPLRRVSAGRWAAAAGAAAAIVGAAGGGGGGVAAPAGSAPDGGAPAAAGKPAAPAAGRGKRQTAQPRKQKPAIVTRVLPVGTGGG